MKKGFIAISTAFLLSWAQVPVRAETKIPKCTRNQTTKFYVNQKKGTGRHWTFVKDAEERLSKVVLTTSEYINKEFLTLEREELRQYAENYARYLAQKEFILWLDPDGKDRERISRVVTIAANMLELCLVNSSQLLITMELTLLGSNLANLLIDYEDLVDNASKGPIPATESEWDKWDAKMDEMENHADKMQKNIENFLINNFAGQ